MRSRELDLTDEKMAANTSVPNTSGSFWFEFGRWSVVFHRYKVNTMIFVVSLEIKLC